MAIVREVTIGDCRLIQGDCLEVMPLLGEFDACKSDAVVLKTDHEQTAIRKRQSQDSGGEYLGGKTRSDTSTIHQRGFVAKGDGADFRSNTAGLSEGVKADGNSLQKQGQGGKSERALHRRNSIDDLSEDGQKGGLQSLPVNGDVGNSSHRPQSHEQHSGELRGSLQSVSHEPSQDGVVALPKGWSILTDPPYGIGYDGQKGGARGRGFQRDYIFKGWDSSAPDMLWACGDFPCVIWGGNYFGLPAAGKWLSWDKMQKFTGADFELAWTNLKGPSKVFRMSRIEAYGSIDKKHPTQKPIELIEWCIGHLPVDITHILDPFMGSGTTGVACVKMGRSFTGIELDPDYFDIAVERIRKAYEQPDFLIEPPAPKSKPLPAPSLFDEDAA